jgi:hypothetical protein
MKSALIEFLRFGKEPGILREGDPYLATLNSEPVRQFAMPMDQAVFFDNLNYLRYPKQDNWQEQKQALETLSKTVTQILQPPESEGQPLQLDLVTNAAELWALPFEALRGADELPLLVNPEKVVVLTRRIRGEFFAMAPKWPARPKILFAYATPGWANLPEVPALEHATALRAALKPWIEPLPGDQVGLDEQPVFQIIPNASLQAIAQTCQEARQAQKPFTHVHILAHGWPVQEGGPHRTHYGLALESDYGKPATAEDLVEVLKPLDGTPVIVTLAVCDAGNEANIIVPAKSMAQMLHRSGVPVVVASQLPLTFTGSIVLTREFYGGLLSGSDVREALHAMRTALYQTPAAGHDWVSITAYVQLPEGYADHLLEVRLRAELASLDTAQCWSDHLIQSGSRDEAALDRVALILEERIGKLAGFLAELKKISLRQGVFEENAGLLGSANKRLAELSFFRAGIWPDKKGWLLDQSRAALERAHQAYVEGNNFNLSHHWTGVQHLSLEAVLTGQLKKVGYWHAALQAADIDLQHEQEYWAQGSMAELYLLAPLAEQASQLDKAGNLLLNMKQRVRDYAGSNFPMESIGRQLRRYITWWTKENGFFPNRATDLAADAQKLLKIIE